MAEQPAPTMHCRVWALAAFPHCSAVAEAPDYAAMMAKAVWDWRTLLASGRREQVYP